MAKAETSFVYGLNTVLNLLQQAPHKVQVLFLDQAKHEKRQDEILRLAQQHGISVQGVDKSFFHRRVGDAGHQGVMAQIIPQYVLTEKELYPLLDQLDTAPFLLCLDSIQDPHNLGACLRSADAAGVHAVIAPKDRATGITPVVSKVASGAAEVVPFFQVTNLSRCLRELKQRGIWCIGLDGEADNSLYQADLRGPLALVLGAEGAGLRRLTAETCDSLVALPMHGTVSSLNVSVTTGIALYEAVRQRQPD